VRAYDEEKKLARIEVKNRFEKGDEIEFLTPEKIWTIKVTEIFKINNVNHSVEKT